MFKSYDIIDGRIVECQPERPGRIQVYTTPDEDDKRHLVEECGIDEHTFYSALDDDEISRIEYEEKHVAVIMKQPRNYKGDRNLEFRVASLGVFLFKDRTIILQAEPMYIFEHGKMPLRGNSIPGILLRLLYHSTHHFLEHLRIIRSISDEIENKIEFSVTNKALVNMFTLLKSLTYYESAISANQMLLAKMRSDSRKLGFTEDEEDFLDDITVENKQCNNLAGIYSGILTGMSDARVSVVSNNLAIIMKQLAIINVVFMPLSVITGLGGMSEFTMMTGHIWWPHSYSALVLVMVAIGYITYLLVKRVGLGERKNH
ncbi:MAG: magnesium transporter CorA family protein [Victivallaceae bacterium]|nr:magnesium transporter CorA family protein [Victivallaceae bacterium]